MPSPERQIQFLTDLQRILSEGLFASTYKYALLMSLADIAVEGAAGDDNSVTISSAQIAEKFIGYYWRQSAPFLPSDSIGGLAVLRQNTGTQAGIIRVIQKSRAAHQGSINQARSSSKEWNRLVAHVGRFVREMPLWKLQNIGGERLEFIYENLGRGSHITLKPGVAYCLRKHYSLVIDLVRGAWSRYVRRFNADVLGEQTDLSEFLFGSERSDLSSVLPILQECQHGECFYCCKPLKDVSCHVDHFIPWSRYPVDLGHNFVAAHASCNAKKSDRLAADEHLDRWIERHRALGFILATEFARAGIVSNLTSSARIVHWAYQQASDAQGMTWVRGDELRKLSPDWNRGLTSILN